MSKIITRYDPKPIPVRRFDWTAVHDDYDLGSPIGYGTTEAEALADFALLDEERAEAFMHIALRDEADALAEGTPSA